MSRGLQSYSSNWQRYAMEFKLLKYFPDSSVCLLYYSRPFLAPNGAAAKKAESDC